MFCLIFCYVFVFDHSALLLRLSSDEGLCCNRCGNSCAWYGFYFPFLLFFAFCLFIVRCCSKCILDSIKMRTVSMSKGSLIIHFQCKKQGESKLAKSNKPQSQGLPQNLHNIIIMYQLLRLLASQNL